jgi:hypothetical protein
MPDLLGIDVGLSLKRSSTGISRIGSAGFSVGHVNSDPAKRLEMVKPVNGQVFGQEDELPP